MNIYNVIAANWLAKQCLERTMALPSGANALRRNVHEVGPSVRIIARLRATIETRVPVGYEDKSGFHYGAETTDVSFKI